MGVCASTKAPVSEEEKKRQAQIESQLRSAKKNANNEVKLLLLGTGESGKSTIAKQLKILHLEGFSEQERRFFRDTIHSNVIQGIRVLISACKRFDWPLDPENQDLAAEIMSEDIMNQNQEVLLNQPLAEKVKKLLSDSGIKTAISNSSSFQFASESALYYFEHIDRLVGNFIPTDDDILRVRVKTTGVKEVVFTQENHTFRIVDVGGQRSERKKWIHVFEEVNAIIFCVALSEYDQKLFEDESVNRMHESIKLFDEVCNSRWFKKTSIILFLNKRDLFEVKITKVDLKLCFPDYEGGPSYDNGLEYIKKEFQSLDLNEKFRKIYIHITCATDTNNIQKVFKDVKDIAISQTLSEMNL